MFGRIAHRYDVLNRTLSLGQDMSWRRAVARRVSAIDDPRVLDVCSGTGDLALTVGGGVVGADFCLPMLERARLKARRLRQPLPLCAADALRLPFAEATFDVVTVAFGVRNFADLEVGLGELVRVLRPGGVLLVLEFSRPRGVIGASPRVVGPSGASPGRSVVVGRRRGVRLPAGFREHFPGRPHHVPGARRRRLDGRDGASFDGGRGFVVRRHTATRGGHDERRRPHSRRFEVCG